MDNPTLFKLKKKIDGWVKYFRPELGQTQGLNVDISAFALQENF